MLKKTFQTLSLMLAVVVLIGCTTKHVSMMKPIIYTEDKAKVLFYREGIAADKPVTLMVKDRVVGVIKGNQYLEASVCSGAFPVRVFTRAGDTMSEKSSEVNVQDKATVFVLTDTTAAPKVVTDVTKEKITEGKVEGTYAVNRYVPKCLRYIDISADVLFAFDESILSLRGEEELRKLADVLKKEAVQTESIVVEGHTDRLGSAQYNDKLSLARAETVMNYLKLQGIDTPMTPRGMGESIPVTDGCPSITQREKLHECLQPDRRVRIELVGKTYKALSE
ncbi:MAG: OmpA family protein [Burkholderiales bacterium]|nr:OmpA family protein [Burkholderiales bacterium]